jgi:hypothetical protein
MSVGVKFQDMSIKVASFLDNSVDISNSSTNSDVVVAGRKPYFYNYDMNSGSITKIMGKHLSYVYISVTPNTMLYLLNLILYMYTCIQVPMVKILLVTRTW